jgi:pilus assembly protein Flp/PilA
MLSLIRRFGRDERGATATEYAMLIVFVALAIAVGAQTLGNGINNLYTNITNTISTIPMPSP